METAVGIRPQLSIFGDDYDTEDGTCIRDYVHVNDLADAHVRSLEYIAEKDISITVNLGSQNGVSVKEMVQKAREITGKPIPVKIAPRRPGDAAKMVASSKEAFRILGWKANFSDADTLISSTWKVYKKHFPNA
jgi:UDP-glucose 4-epimerase